MKCCPFHAAVARIVLAMLVIAIAGCANSNTVDLETWVQEVKSRQHPRVEPLPEFIPFETFLYRAKDLRDPFTRPEVEPSATVAQVIVNGIHPEPNRRRESLEGYPLDSLQMVGTLDRDKDSWALVRDPGGSIHRVQPGNYVGQNHGRITAISEYKLSVTEIVPDGVGGWIERAAALALNE